MSKQLDNSQSEVMKRCSNMPARLIPFKVLSLEAMSHAASHFQIGFRFLECLFITTSEQCEGLSCSSIAHK